MELEEIIESTDEEWDFTEAARLSDKYSQEGWISGTADETTLLGLLQMLEKATTAHVGRVQRECASLLGTDDLSSVRARLAQVHTHPYCCEFLISNPCCSSCSESTSLAAVRAQRCGRGAAVRRLRLRAAGL